MGGTKLSGCHGDSGGPYVCKIGTNWELHGALSWGSPRCSSRETFTVFANIAYFKSWIEKNVAGGDVDVITRTAGTDSACTDRWESCPRYEHRCNTSSNVKKYCCKTCQSTGTDSACTDRWGESCPRLKHRCNISSNVKKYCCKTCQSTKSACRDLYKSCPKYKYLCKINRKVKISCCKTCQN